MNLVGQALILRVRIVDINGIPTDPATFALTIKDPLGGVQNITILTKNAVGDWNYVLPLTMVGDYLWDCITTNPPTATGIIEIPVMESRVAPP